MIERLLPMYALVAAGFFAGRYLRLQKETIAPLLIYFITPLVVFHGVSIANLGGGAVYLPVLFFIFCAAMCLAVFRLAKKFHSPARNILAFACGNGNSGYFALPVGISLLGTDALSLIVLSSFGFILNENTIGFYLVARGRHGVRESVLKVLRLPSVYAFGLGLLVKSLSWQPQGVWHDLLVNMRGTYSVLGMMIIGLALADLKAFAVDLPFTIVACAAKFLLWPAAAALLLLLDRNFLGLFEPQVARVIFFMSTVPLAANTVAIASLLGAEPEKSAIAVLISTFVALPAIPLLMAFLCP